MSEKVWREERIKQQQVIQERVPTAKRLLDELPNAYPERFEGIDINRHTHLTYTRNIFQDLANQIDAYVILVDKEKDATLRNVRREPLKQTNVQGRGYRLIFPNLSNQLSFDAQVRCLSYLLKEVDAILSQPQDILYRDKYLAVPQGIFFEIVPVQSHGGGPYPTIGMYADDSVDRKLDLDVLADTIGEKLERYVHKVKLDHLMELSAQEPNSWNDILTKFGMLDWLPINRETSHE